MQSLADTFEPAPQADLRKLFLSDFPEPTSVYNVTLGVRLYEWPGKELSTAAAMLAPVAPEADGIVVRMYRYDIGGKVRNDMTVSFSHPFTGLKDAAEQAPKLAIAFGQNMVKLCQPEATAVATYDVRAEAGFRYGNTIFISMLP